MAIAGIKSVDFLIKATGEGIVNHNGSFPVYSPAAGKVLKNHVFPKLRGLDPLQRVPAQLDGEQASLVLRLDDPALATASVIVSSACIRAGLFRDVSFGLKEVTTSNAARILASLHGLVRGYLITDGKRNMARKSPLHVTEFECSKPGLVFNQGSNSRTRGTDREDTSLYSFFSTGKDLEYCGKASLSIEDLQFIPMEDSLGRSSYDFTTTVTEGQRVASGITEFLQTIAASGLKPEARFVKKAVRIGAVERVGDAGVLLNDHALRVVADEVAKLIENLTIRQGKGYLLVTSVVIDYNASGRIFRAERTPDEVVARCSEPFAMYYQEEGIGDEEFEFGQTKLAREQQERQRDKDKKGHGRGKKGKSDLGAVKEGADSPVEP